MSNVAAGKDTDDEGEALNDVEKVLNKLDIKLRDSVGEWRNFEDVLDEVADKWKNFGETERSQIATAIAGTRQQETFRALMNNYDQVRDLTEVAANSTGTASKKMETYLDSVEAKTNELKATWESLVMSLNQSESYKGFLDICIGLLNNLPAVIGYITSLIALFKGNTIFKALSNIEIKSVSLFKNIKNLKDMSNLLEKNLVRTAQGGVKFASAEEKAATATTILNTKIQLLQMGFAALIAVISIGIQAYSSWKQANMEAAKAASEEAQTYTNKAQAMEDAIDKYKEIYNSTTDYATKQEQLKNLSTELVTAYGKEADVLDLLNGKYQDNISLMQQKANEERKKALGEYNVAVEKGKSNLANAMNLWRGDEEYKLTKNKQISKQGNENIINDINNILSSKNTHTDYIAKGNPNKEAVGGSILTNGDKITGIKIGQKTSNQDALKYAQDLQEYLDENVNTLSDEWVEMITGIIEKVRSTGNVGVDEDALEQYDILQKQQLAKVTQNDDGSIKQEIVDYKKLQEEKQKLQEEYNTEENEKEKEKIKKQLADKENAIKDAIDKIKKLYDKDDTDQSTLSEKQILSYIGADGSKDTSSSNVYSYLTDKQKDEYAKIKEDARKSGELSNEAIKKLQEMRDGLSGEQKDNFIKAINDDLDNLGIKAKLARADLDKLKLSQDYNNATENGHWKSEEDEKNFKNKVRNNAAASGVATNTQTYSEAEALLDGTEEGLNKFYNKLSELIDSIDKKKEETKDYNKKKETTDSTHTYGEGKVGTGSSSSFKSYLDDIKDVQTIQDKLTSGKVADYSDVEKLRSKTGKAADKLNAQIEKDGKVTSKALQSYIDDTLEYVNDALDKAIDRFDDTCEDIDKLVKNSDAPEDFQKGFEDATDEVAKDLKDDKKLKVGNIEIDSTNLDDVTDAINDATFAKDNMNEAFSDNSAIDDSVFKMTAMAMGFANGAEAAGIMKTALDGVDEEGLNDAWNRLSEETKNAVQEQNNFTWSTLSTEEKRKKLEELAGSWNDVDIYTRNALASMSAYFGTYNGASDEKKKDYGEKVGLVNQKIYMLAGAARNEASYRRGTNTSSPSKSGSGSKNKYSAEDAASDLKDILQDIEDYEADIELELEDQTEELINHYDLERNKLDTLKEELDYYDSIYDVTENTTKWLDTQLKILDEESKKVAEIQNANDKIDKQRQKIYNENSSLNVQSWFDSEGNETLAYGDLLNSFEYRKNQIEKETAAAMRAEYDKVASSKDKDTISAAKDRIKQIEEEGDIKIKQIDKERDYVENVYDSVSQLNDAWKDNQEAIRESLQELNDRVKSIRDELIDDIMEQLERAVDKMNTSVEKDVTRLEQLKQVQESYNSILNDTIDTQQELEDELKANMDSYQYLDDTMRQLMFNEDDYKQLSGVIEGIQSDIANIWEDHYNQIQNLTEDEMYKAEYITNETERQLAAKQKEYDLAKAELDVAKAQTNLNNVKNERNTRIFANGEWQWVIYNYAHTFSNKR